MIKSYFKQVFRQKAFISFFVQVVFACNFFNIQAQNLVPNPSFENYTSCPTSFSSGNDCNNPGYLDEVCKAVPWKNPRVGNITADYFNSCGFIDASIPINFGGVQPARTGNAYVGLIAYDSGSPIREYVHVPLISSLVAGRKYLASMYISIADTSAYAVDGIGMLFTKDTATTSIGYLSFNPSLIPQVENPSGVILEDSVNWVLLSGNFTAVGGESYLTIGNFKEDGELTIKNRLHNSVYYPNCSYYYIDDVSVTEAAEATSFSINKTCFGDSTAFAFDDTSGIASVSWNFGDYFSGAFNTSNKIFPKHKFTSAGNFTVTANIAFRDGTTGSLIQTVTIKSPPPVNIAQDVVYVCTGNKIVLKASGASTYQWYEKQSGSFVIGGNDSLVVFPNDTMKYWVTGTDIGGCTFTDTVNVFASKGTATKIIASDSICYGSSAELIGSGADTYSWIIQGNPTPVSTNQGFFPILYADTTYILTGTNSFGCVTKDTVRVIVRPKPVVTATANDTTICPGDIIKLSGKGAFSYSWAYKTNPDFFLSADSVFFDSPTDTVIYIAIGTDTYGCKDTTEREVVVYPKPEDISILGVPYVCPGTSNVFYKSNKIDFSSTYTWTISSGNTPLTQTANPAKFNFGAAGIADISMQETNIYSCKGNIATYQVEIQTVLTPQAPKGKDTVCTADAIDVKYYSPYKTPGSTYSWHITGGNITNTNADTIKVTWTATGANAGKVWYDESGSGGCMGVSDTLKVSIFSSPNTGGILGDNSLCVGEAIVYSVNSSNTSGYLWTVSSGGTITAGQGTRFAQIDWTIAGPQQVKVKEINQQGCSGIDQILNVTVFPLPVLSPADVKGIFNVCQSTVNGQVYFIDPVKSNPNSKYNWNLQGGTIINGNGNDTITVNWDFNTNLVQNINVYEINKDSCISNGITKAVTVDGAIPEIIVVSLNPDGNRAIDISWKVSYKGSQLNTYDLYRRTHNNTDPNNLWQLIAKDYISTTYEDRDVNTGKYSYQYRYAILDNCGDTSISIPHNSMLLKAEADQVNNTVKLNWNRYNNWKEGVARYEVWRRLDGETNFSLYQEVGQDTIFFSKNGQEGFEHCYRIKAIEKAGTAESWSNDTCVNFMNLINIPSAFSPNGDGVNDTWVIRNAEAYKNISIEIFNRWGEVVYTTKGYTVNWDGTKNNKHVPDATYYYVIKLNYNLEGRKNIYSGTVTIIR
jgi:gliding motility-associated-like protein